MKIEYAVQCPDKSHALRVGLRYELATDGKDEIHDVPVRKSHYESLTAAKKLAYVQECAKWHHKRDKTVREKWDADDKAKADAAVAAAKAAEEAKFVMRHVATTAEGVTVSVTWQGVTAQHVIPNDPANAVANAQAAHQVLLDAKAAEAQAVSVFNVG